MGIVSGEPVSVSLDDADASRDELEALRTVMRSDEPYFDEPPVLEESYHPSEADSLWWAEETSPEDFPSSYDRWLDSLQEPEPTPGGFFGWGPGVDPC